MTSSANTIQNTQTEQANRIKKLPPLLINQLAAGEVVTRPASVVKELIENAIDAGAHHITVRIMQGGMDSIEVSDDGCGIHADDMMMAVTRFATSKIADVAQLQGIATLGFRGEALAATAAVSRLTLKSSSDNSGVGRELMVAGILDDTPNLLPIVHPRGTTVIVKDLYFNVPARRGNLKSISTEFAHIETVVRQLALVASDVDISLWHNDKRRFQFDAVDNIGFVNASHLNNSDNNQSALMQRMISRLKMISPSIFGADNPSVSINISKQTSTSAQSNLIPVTLSLEGLLTNDVKLNSKGASEVGILGYLIPYLYTSNTNYKLIYINGRLVKDKRIAQSLRECMKSIPELIDLGYVLFFRLPQVWLNVNVHPSKQSIKIQNLPNIVAHLEVGIKNSLQRWYKTQKTVQTDSNKNNTESFGKRVINDKEVNNKTVINNGQSHQLGLNHSSKRSELTGSNDTLYYREDEPAYEKETSLHTLYENQQSYHTKNNINSDDKYEFRGRGNARSNNDRSNIEDLQSYQYQSLYSSKQSSKHLSKHLSKIKTISCLYRLPVFELSVLELPIFESSTKTDSVIESGRPDLSQADLSQANLSQESVLVLLKWHECFYLFAETILLDVILSQHDIKVEVYRALTDSEKLGWLTDYLSMVLNAMSEQEQSGFITQAVANLSFTELMTVMLNLNNTENCQ